MVRCEDSDKTHQSKDDYHSNNEKIEEAPDFDDLFDLEWRKLFEKSFVDHIPAEEGIGDLARQKPKEMDGAESIVVVDGVEPHVEAQQLEKATFKQMVWGIELWDQFDNIAGHTNKGIDFLEKYGNFVRDRRAIELEYAGQLRRLVKSYTPKKKDEEDYQFTCQKAFRDMLTEVNDQADQHEAVAEHLTSALAKEIAVLVKDFKADRKKALQERARLQTTLSQQLIILDRAQKNYKKAFCKAERAVDAYRKADADMNMSRAEIEKQRINLSIKNNQCDDSKNEYAKQLQKTNELQSQHYQVLMPAVFQQLQELDDKRIKLVENYVRKGVDIERNGLSIINKCLDGIIRAADSISPEEDSRLVIERYKSGFLHPADIPFEDLSNVRSGSVDSDSSSNGLKSGPLYSNVTLSSSCLKSDIKSGTISAMKSKERTGLFQIFNASVSNLNAEPSLPRTPQPSRGSSHSLESGVGSHTSHTSLPDSEVERLHANAVAEIDAKEEDDTLNEEFYESDPLPILGTCRALYAFEDQSEGSFPLNEGEELYVIKVDQGNGWTGVRRNSRSEEGFVPTSYIQCTLDNTC